MNKLKLNERKNNRGTKKPRDILIALSIAFFVILFFTVELVKSVGLWYLELLCHLSMVVPLQIWLFLNSKDNENTNKKRKICLLIFWIINCPYIIIALVYAISMLYQ